MSALFPGSMEPVTLSNPMIFALPSVAVCSANTFVTPQYSANQQTSRHMLYGVTSGQDSSVPSPMGMPFSMAVFAPAIMPSNTTFVL